MQNWVKKLKKRLKTVSVYGIGQSAGALSQLIISYLIIKFNSIELWGSYVEILIWVNLLLLFSAFGNRDFLLKSFSSNPSKINQLWLTNFINRILLLLPCFLIIILVPFFNNIRFIAILWLSFLFISQSYQILILYHKDFKFGVIVEIIFNALIIICLSLKVKSINLELFLIITTIANAIKGFLYILFYHKRMKGLAINFSFINLKKSVPFFIPLTLGTVRIKIDTYYANSFFNSIDLGKYQILISFLTIGHIATTYFVNPFLKNFFRSNTSIIKKIIKQFLIAGFIYALIFTVLSYFAMQVIYNIEFTLLNYIMAFIFIIPLLVHSIIINQMYKYNKQNIVAYVALIIVVLQIIIGFFVIKKNGISGALIIKAVSQVIITIIFWLWLTKYKRNSLING